MAESVTVGNPPIRVAVRRNVAARRVILSLGRLGCMPLVTAPSSVSIARIESFVREQEQWLREKIEQGPTLIAVTDGTIIPFRGSDVTIALQPHGPSSVRDGRLLLSGLRRELPAKAASFFKEAARDACVNRALAYAGQLQRNVGKVTIRDPRGRWGSCNSRGDLMFSWRLILAPPRVLHYVVAHEVAHVVELNHSSRFWRIVHDIFGDYEAERAWLRTQGKSLMRFDFSTGDDTATK